MSARQRSPVRLAGGAALVVGAILVAILLVTAGNHGHQRPRVPTTGAGSHAAQRTAVPAPRHTQVARTRHCALAPGACGYPDRTNTGVSPSVHLTPRTGTIDVQTPGQTISGLALTGAIEVNADNTTIENDDIIVKGSQKGCSDPCGGRGIYIAPGVKHTLIENVTCQGGAPTGADVTEFCIISNDQSSVINRVHAFWCTTCFIGPATWENSFVNLNGTIPKEHYEDIYYGGGSNAITIHHNTLLAPPHDQGDTATIFLSVDFGDERNVSVTDNLLAGRAYVLYGGASGSKGSVIGPMVYTGNRMSTLFVHRGGFYGIGTYFKDSVTRWMDNYWDDTLRKIRMP
jgi:hypothetical protein